MITDAAPAPLPPPEFRIAFNSIPSREKRIAGLLADIDHLQARLDVLDDEARALRREADTARQALADLLTPRSR